MMHFVTSNGTKLKTWYDNLNLLEKVEKLCGKLNHQIEKDHKVPLNSMLNLKTSMVGIVCNKLQCGKMKKGYFGNYMQVFAIVEDSNMVSLEEFSNSMSELYKKYGLNFEVVDGSNFIPVERSVFELEFARTEQEIIQLLTNLLFRRVF